MQGMQRMPPSPSESVSSQDPAQDPSGPGRLLMDLSKIDLSQRLADKEAIAKWNPHRGVMAFLDAVVWHAPDWSYAVGLRQVRGDEFWVDGHFPSRPMYPGVLQIETAAQLACWVFTNRKGRPLIAAFLRIEDCAFRSQVNVGDDMYVILKDIKYQRRRFISQVQGVVGDRITFDATISGMSMEKD